MPFVERHNQIVQKLKPASPFSLWLRTIIFSWIVFGLCLGYLFLRSNRISTFNVNQAAANASVFLIGLSFLLSSVCYFFDFADTKIIYRKHLGIIGFSFALAHVVFVVVVLQEMFPFVEWFTTRALTASLGLVATIIFTFMTLISNAYAARELGGVVWRASLRYGGYAALIFVWFHAVLTSFDRWWGWALKPSGLPPLGLLGAVFTIVVLLARVVLFLAIWRDKKKKLMVAALEPTA